MTIIDEILAELRVYEADNQEVEAVCMNLATMTRIILDAPVDVYNLNLAEQAIHLMGHPVKIINDIPFEMFVIAVKPVSWFDPVTGSIYFNRSSGITVSNGTSVQITGNFNAAGSWSFQPPAVATPAPAPTPRAKPKRGRVKPNFDHQKTKGELGIEREKANWKHLNKRSR